MMFKMPTNTNTNNQGTAKAARGANSFQGVIGEVYATQPRPLSIHIFADGVAGTYQATSKYATAGYPLIDGSTRFRYRGRVSPKAAGTDNQSVKGEVLEGPYAGEVVHFDDSHVGGSAMLYKPNAKAPGMVASMGTGAVLDEEEELSVMEARLEEMREEVEARRLEVEKAAKEKEATALADAMALLKAKGAKVLLPEEQDDVEETEEVESIEG